MKTNSDTTTKLYIGFDVHKEKTTIALAQPDAGGEVRSYGEVATTQIALERTIRKIAKILVRMKVQCTVVAPSLIPFKAGDQIKTDKREPMKKLLRLLPA